MIKKAQIQFICITMSILLGVFGVVFGVSCFIIKNINSRSIEKTLDDVQSGFISMKANDNTMIRLGIATSFVGIVLLALPLGNISLAGLLLIGVGFGPIFPSILHSVPNRFGKEYSADITGFHMGGAYGIGFAIQLLFGFVATATTFNITPFVLLALCIGLFMANETTIKTLKKK
jgi:hypothetical protein